MPRTLAHCRDLPGHLNILEPSLMLLVTPVLSLPIVTQYYVPVNIIRFQIFTIKTKFLSGAVTEPQLSRISAWEPVKWRKFGSSCVRRSPSTHRATCLTFSTMLRAETLKQGQLLTAGPQSSRTAHAPNPQNKLK